MRSKQRALTELLVKSLLLHPLSKFDENGKCNVSIEQDSNVLNSIPIFQSLSSLLKGHSNGALCSTFIGSLPKSLLFTRTASSNFTETFHFFLQTKSDYLLSSAKWLCQSAALEFTSGKSVLSWTCFEEADWTSLGQQGYFKERK